MILAWDYGEEDIYIPWEPWCVNLMGVVVDATTISKPIELGPLMEKKNAGSNDSLCT